MTESRDAGRVEDGGVTGRWVRREMNHPECDHVTMRRMMGWTRQRRCGWRTPGVIREGMLFLSWSKVLPPLGQTGDGNATTCWDKDEQPERNLGYYCRRSVIAVSAFSKVATKEPNQTFFKLLKALFNRLKMGWRECNVQVSNEVFMLTNPYETKTFSFSFV